MEKKKAKWKLEIYEYEKAFGSRGALCTVCKKEINGVAKNVS